MQLQVTITNSPQQIDVPSMPSAETAQQKTHIPRLDYPLPVAVELLPERLYQYGSPQTGARRTDILLEDAKIQLFYQRDPSGDTDMVPRLLGIDISKERDTLQINVNTIHHDDLGTSFEFSLNGEVLQGRGYGDIEAAVIKKFLNARVPTDEAHFVPPSVFALMSEFLGDH